MNAAEAIKLSIDMGRMISTSYLGDLTDEEMMHRPHPMCNHIKWQLGHLIASEHFLVSGVAPGSMPPLPDGFAEKYGTDKAAVDDPAAFDSKTQLLEIYEQQRAATLAALAKQTDEQLSAPSPEQFQSYAPTVAAVFEMQGSHYVMHAGQWAVIRRQLGRPPMF